MPPPSPLGFTSNPDTRILPTGWRQCFDPRRQQWFYQNDLVRPPGRSLVHPLDALAGNTSASGRSGRSATSASSGMSFAQQLYASARPPPSNQNSQMNANQATRVAPGNANAMNVAARTGANVPSSSSPPVVRTPAPSDADSVAHAKQSERYSQLQEKTPSPAYESTERGASASASSMGFASGSGSSASHLAQLQSEVPPPPAFVSPTSSPPPSPPPPEWRSLSASSRRARRLSWQTQSDVPPPPAFVSLTSSPPPSPPPPEWQQPEYNSSDLRLNMDGNTGSSLTRRPTLPMYSLVAEDGCTLPNPEEDYVDVGRLVEGVGGLSVSQQSHGANGDRLELTGRGFADSDSAASPSGEVAVAVALDRDGPPPAFSESPAQLPSVVTPPAPASRAATTSPALTRRTPSALASRGNANVRGVSGPRPGPGPGPGAPLAQATITSATSGLGQRPAPSRASASTHPSVRPPSSVSSMSVSTPTTTSSLSPTSTASFTSTSATNAGANPVIAAGRGIALSPPVSGPPNESDAASYARSLYASAIANAARPVASNAAAGAGARRASNASSNANATNANVNSGLGTNNRVQSPPNTIPAVVAPAPRPIAQTQIQHLQAQAAAANVAALPANSVVTNAVVSPPPLPQRNASSGSASGVLQAGNTGQVLQAQARPYRYSTSVVPTSPVSTTSSGSSSSRPFFGTPAPSSSTSAWARKAKNKTGGLFGVSSDKHREMKRVEMERRERERAAKERVAAAAERARVVIAQQGGVDGVVRRVPPPLPPLKTAVENVQTSSTLPDSLLANPYTAAAHARAQAQAQAQAEAQAQTQVIQAQNPPLQTAVAAQARGQTDTFTNVIASTINGLTQTGNRLQAGMSAAVNSVGNAVGSLANAVTANSNNNNNASQTSPAYYGTVQPGAGVQVAQNTNTNTGTGNGVTAAILGGAAGLAAAGAAVFVADQLGLSDGDGGGDVFNNGDLSSVGLGSGFDMTSLLNNGEGDVMNGFVDSSDGADTFIAGDFGIQPEQFVGSDQWCGAGDVGLSTEGFEVPAIDPSMVYPQDDLDSYDPGFDPGVTEMALDTGMYDPATFEQPQFDTDGVVNQDLGSFDNFDPSMGMEQEYQECSYEDDPMDAQDAPYDPSLDLGATELGLDPGVYESTDFEPPQFDLDGVDQDVGNPIDTQDAPDVYEPCAQDLGDEAETDIPYPDYSIPEDEFTEQDDVGGSQNQDQFDQFNELDSGTQGEDDVYQVDPNDQFQQYEEVLQNVTEQEEEAQQDELEELQHQIEEQQKLEHEMQHQQQQEFANTQHHLEQQAQHEQQMEQHQLQEQAQHEQQMQQHFQQQLHQQSQMQAHAMQQVVAQSQQSQQQQQYYARIQAQLRAQERRQAQYIAQMQRQQALLSQRIQQHLAQGNSDAGAGATAALLEDLKRMQAQQTQLMMQMQQMQSGAAAGQVGGSLNAGTMGPGRPQGGRPPSHGRPQGNAGAQSHIQRPPAGTHRPQGVHTRPPTGSAAPKPPPRPQQTSNPVQQQHHTNTAGHNHAKPPGQTAHVKPSTGSTGASSHAQHNSVGNGAQHHTSGGRPNHGHASQVAPAKPPKPSVSSPGVAGHVQQGSGSGGSKPHPGHTGNGAHATPAPTRPNAQAAPTKPATSNTAQTKPSTGSTGISGSAGGNSGQHHNNGGGTSQGHMPAKLAAPKVSTMGASGQTQQKPGSVRPHTGNTGAVVHQSHARPGAAGVVHNVPRPSGNARPQTTQSQQQWPQVTHSTNQASIQPPNPQTLAALQDFRRQQQAQQAQNMQMLQQMQQQNVQAGPAMVQHLQQIQQQSQLQTAQRLQLLQQQQQRIQQQQMQAMLLTGQQLSSLQMQQLQQQGGNASSNANAQGSQEQLGRLAVRAGATIGGMLIANMLTDNNNN